MGGLTQSQTPGARTVPPADIQHLQIHCPDLTCDLPPAGLGLLQECLLSCHCMDSAECVIRTWREGQEPSDKNLCWIYSPPGAKSESYWLTGQLHSADLPADTTPCSSAVSEEHSSQDQELAQLAPKQPRPDSSSSRAGQPSRRDRDPARAHSGTLKVPVPVRAHPLAWLSAGVSMHRLQAHTTLVARLRTAPGSAASKSHASEARNHIHMQAQSSSKSCHHCGLY